MGYRNEDYELLKHNNNMLLDALQSLLAAFDTDFHDLMLAKMKAQAAINKAKGE